MTTVLDIITDAMKLNGTLFKGEAPSSDEAADALRTLNDMVASWSNDGLITYTRNRVYFYCTAGVSSYTIGTGGSFNTPRPFQIVTAYIRIAAIDYPIEIISDDVYERDIPYKSLRTNFPTYLNYDNGYPLGTIRLFPAPATAAELHMMLEQPLSSFASLTDTVDLPPGWNKALKYNLAIELSPQYGTSPSQVVFAMASEAKSQIMRQSNALRPIVARKVVNRIYNILADR